MDGVTGLSVEDIIFGDDFVRIDVSLTDAAGDQPGLFELRLITEHETTSVPEPGSLALLFAGLFGFAISRRYRIS